MEQQVNKKIFNNNIEMITVDIIKKDKDGNIIEDDIDD